MRPPQRPVLSASNSCMSLASQSVMPAIKGESHQSRSQAVSPGSLSASDLLDDICGRVSALASSETLRMEAVSALASSETLPAIETAPALNHFSAFEEASLTRHMDRLKQSFASILGEARPEVAAVPGPDRLSVVDRIRQLELTVARTKATTPVVDSVPERSAVRSEAKVPAPNSEEQSVLDCLFRPALNVALDEAKLQASASRVARSMPRPEENTTFSQPQPEENTTFSQPTVPASAFEVARSLFQPEQTPLGSERTRRQREEEVKAEVQQQIAEGAALRRKEIEEAACQEREAYEVACRQREEELKAEGQQKVLEEAALRQKEIEEARLESEWQELTERQRIAEEVSCQEREAYEAARRLQEEELKAERQQRKSEVAALRQKEIEEAACRQREAGEAARRLREAELKDEEQQKVFEEAALRQKKEIEEARLESEWQELTEREVTVPAAASRAAPVVEETTPPTAAEEVDAGTEELGAQTLRSIDQALAQRICSSRLADLRTLWPHPMPTSASDASLGTWMIWMVERVAANDPQLTSLDFKNLAMPAPHDEPRIAPKLMEALMKNTHLTELSLFNSNFQGAEQARLLSRALQVNRTLEVLNLECNLLEPDDLQEIFNGLGRNRVLREFRCTDQFCEEQADRVVFKALHDSLQTNFTLQKLGMDLTERHYRDQILKALIRNTEAARNRKKCRGEQQRTEEHKNAVFGREKDLSPIARGAGA